MARDGHIEARSGAEASRLLLIWLSPSFPVGAFAYSHGLEAAVARGLVKSRATLEAWLAVLLSHGSIRNDTILLAAAWGAEPPEVYDINALALALQPSAERRLEAAQQGLSFATAIDAAWPCATIASLRAGVDDDIAYAVAVGVAAAGHGIPLRQTAGAFALAFVQSLVSAAIRLSVIGQTDGQRIIAALLPRIDDLAAFADTATLDDLGGAAFSADLASLEHETLYTRLFRS